MAKLPNFFHFVGSDGQYYWRLRDSNGEIVADGSEGYTTESSVQRAVKNVKDTVKEILNNE